MFFTESYVRELKKLRGMESLKQITFCFSVWQPFEYDESNSAKDSEDLKTTGKKKFEEEPGSDKSLNHKVIGCQVSVPLKIRF